MIIYDSEYRFIGVTNSTIKKLNFPSFLALKYKIKDDFAELFIKKNGFIYKFDYLSWIDYILQNPNNSNAIIKAGDNNFYKLTFTIEPYYFFESGDKGYSLNISSMSEMQIDETELIEIEENSKNINPANIQQEDEFEILPETQTFTFNDNDEETQEFELSTNSEEVESTEFSFENNENDFILPELDKLDNNESQIQLENKNNETENKVDEVELKILKQSESTENKDEDLLPSADDFLEEFRTSDVKSEELNLSSEKKEDEECPLPQKNIDDIFKTKDIKVLDNVKSNIKKFSIDNYPIDEVCKELNINSGTLSSFLSDFIHHINHLKNYIYTSIESHQIQNVQKAIFMVKGLARNLRICDIYDELKKIYNKHYLEIGELTKDINHIYSMVEDFIQKLDGMFLVKDNTELRISTSSLNKAQIPDILFQDLLDSFIKLYDYSKEEIEESLNPEKVKRLKELIEQLNNIGQNLSIEEISNPLTKIIEKLQSDDIAFEKIIVDWLDLVAFVEALERKK
jgi:hypothetical protein